jgi:hypothetical protein
MCRVIINTVSSSVEVACQVKCKQLLVMLCVWRGALKIKDQANSAKDKDNSVILLMGRGALKIQDQANNAKDKDQPSSVKEILYIKITVSYCSCDDVHWKIKLKVSDAQRCTQACREGLRLRGTELPSQAQNSKVLSILTLYGMHTVPLETWRLCMKLNGVKDKLQAHTVTLYTHFVWYAYCTSGDMETLYEAKRCQR